MNESIALSFLLTGVIAGFLLGYYFLYDPFSYKRYVSLYSKFRKLTMQVLFLRAENDRLKEDLLVHESMRGKLSDVLTKVSNPDGGIDYYRSEFDDPIV